MRFARADVLAFLDADCRAPIRWLERIEQRLERRGDLVAATGPYRFYDWHRRGSLLIRSYDLLVAPATHWCLHSALNAGAILYGGNFAVRREALTRIGGFDRTIEFHGEDTNLGRRLTAVGRIALCQECWVWTSARRYRAMGTAAVCRLYVRNFWSEILRHRPADKTHLDVRAQCQTPDPFDKTKHLYSWKTLLRCEKIWPAIAAAIRANVDVALTLYRDIPASAERSH